MPSMSRTLRCFAAASSESAPTTPIRSPSATESDGIACAAADQQHGGVARGIGIVERRARGRIAIQPAQHRRMQRPHPQCGAQPRQQTIEIAAALGERDGVCRQRRRGIDGDQRKIGFCRGDLLGERIETGLGGFG